MDLAQIKEGVALELDGQNFIVVKAQHSKIGRGGALVKSKLKNLKTKALIDRTIKPSDSFDYADVNRSKASYLYADQSKSFFMDASSFEQFSIENDSISAQQKFLKEGLTVDVLLIGEEAVAIELPKKVDYKVIEAPPNVKGNTASGANKSVQIETGASITVPMFIKEGDIIKVNTTDNRYVERVSN